MHYLKLLTLLFLLIASLNSYADWIPFEFKNNHITIEVEINGHPVQAILDSGANINMINRSFVEKHGQNFRKTRKVRIKGVNGSSHVQLYNNIPVKMFGGEFDLDDIGVGEFGDSTLLLSSRFFSNVIVQIDFPNSRLQLFPKKSVDMDKFENVPMKRVRSSGLPAVQVKINGKKVWLTFDTGNSGAIYLKRSLAVNEGWLTAETKVKQAMYQGLSKIARVDQFKVNSLKIGPYELEGVSIQVPAEGENTNVGESKRETATANNSRISRGIKSKGDLGFGILKHFIVTVDLDDYQLHIVAP